MHSRASAEHPKNCPCKFIPLKLNAFTLATFGALHLSEKPPKLIQRDGFLSLATDSGGFSPLHYSAQWDKKETVLHIVRHLSDANGTSGNALERAILYNKTSSNTTPLHAAAASGAREALNVLLCAVSVEALKLAVTPVMSSDIPENVLVKAVKEGRSDCLTTLMEFIARKSGERSIKNMFALESMESPDEESTFSFWVSFITKQRELVEANEALGTSDVFDKQRDYNRTLQLINFALFGCNLMTSSEEYCQSCT